MRVLSRKDEERGEGEEVMVVFTYFTGLQRSRGTGCGCGGR